MGVTTLLGGPLGTCHRGGGIWDGFLWLKRSLIVEVGERFCWLSERPEEEKEIASLVLEEHEVPGNEWVTQW